MTAIDRYLNKIEAKLSKGNATEHTHRPALETLLGELDTAIEATNEPQRIKCGAPDFIITSGLIPVGYVEAKDVGVSLDRAAKSPQLLRYRESLTNLVLTDYLSFQLFRDGVLVDTVRIGKWANGKLRRDPAAFPKLVSMFTAFYNAKGPTIKTAQDLAERVAMFARLLRDLVTSVFDHETKKGDLHSQYEAFTRVLIADLKVDQFADMYAQTIAYGLFAARANHKKGPFTRLQAGADLPKTNPFLRKLFNTIAGADLDDRISWAVNDLVNLLDRSDMSKILADFGKMMGRKDPVFHFYETFLAAYDPDLRETRGVYYTPEPVVEYIVSSIDGILKTDFGLAKGLANKDTVKIDIPVGDGSNKTKMSVVHKVQILDPACGTGTFLHSVIAHIYAEFAKVKGMWPDYAAKHLLPRLYGFELLMAPYAVAHLKLALQLGETGYNISSAERLRIFLTNALERGHDTSGLSLFAQWLADEASAALDVKRDAPIMVVLGNPPYSGHSANKGAWIESLIGEYKKSPALHKPAQAKWLSDDYVKFIRFAQWRIARTGYGVLGFVTNHAWLDNPTFMDMRASLLNTFDKLYILDVHGNHKKNERPPPGVTDQNIFDIQQGIVICVLVKSERGAGHATSVLHHELWGDREGKYNWLSANSVSTTPWQSITPSAPQRLFIPPRSSAALIKEYEKGWSLGDIMNVNGAPVPGFATQHDDFAISYTEDEAIDKVRRFLATSTEKEAREIFALCTQDQWQYDRAKLELTIKTAKKELVSVAYRPFDPRVSIYDRNVLTHRRERMSRQMMQPNIALCLPKNAEAVGGEGSHLFFCVDRPADLNFFRRGGAYLLPLYVYGDDVQLDLLGHHKKPRENISKKFREALEASVGTKGLATEDIFAYIYCVLWSEGYNDRYATLLNRGFARIPITSDKALFRKLVGFGKRLVDLHLLRARGVHEPDYPIAGDNLVETVKRAGSRVYINDDQYFDNVSDEAWDLKIGGYPVALKWLKDRKARKLSFDELDAYRAALGAINETLTILDDIEKFVPGWPLL